VQRDFVIQKRLCSRCRGILRFKNGFAVGAKGFCDSKKGFAVGAKGFCDSKKALQQVQRDFVIEKTALALEQLDLVQKSLKVKRYEAWGKKNGQHTERSCCAL
jgi:hypothetical protein